MTINANNRNNYTGNGNVDTYAYGFKINAEADLLVTVRDTDDVETTLVLNTDYTVTGVGEAAGGNVVLVDANQDWIDAGGDLVTNYVLSVRRVVDLIQETDIRNQGDFYPEVHEDAFDRQVMISQQQQDEIDRSVKLPETVSSGFDLTLPADIVGVVSKAPVTNSAGDGWAAAADWPSAAGISGASASAAAAAVSAAAALVSENNAETAETNAETAETNAETAQAAAEAAQAAAEAAQAAAEAAQAAAETAETNAETAETNAETAETNAETAETNAEAAQVAAEAARDAAAASAVAADASADAAAISETNAAASVSNVTALVTLSGVAAGSTSLGTFTGSTIADSSTVKSALQALETVAEAVFVGDSGSGGVKGLVPAPASGDAAADKFLKANGSWTALASAAPTIFGSRGTPRSVVAATGITTGASHMSDSAAIQDIYVEGSAAGDNVCATISDGTVDGQRMTLIARNSAQTLSIDGTTTNVITNGPWTGAENDSITLRWDTSDWCEVCRNN